jgi:transposase
MSVMESMERRKPRPRRSFTPEFKAEIVELCGRGDRSIGQVARDFDLTETAVREWVRQAERDTGSRRDGGLTSAERQELSALRRENRRLREDVEILKRATSFFALMTVARSLVSGGGSFLCFQDTLKARPDGLLLPSADSGHHQGQ